METVVAMRGEGGGCKFNAVCLGPRILYSFSPETFE